jgi:hypothetical protein
MFIKTKKGKIKLLNDKKGIKLTGKYGATNAKNNKIADK